jgi:transcription elongation factor GreA
MTKNTVSLNSKITIRCNNVIKTYQLVRSENLDSSTTKISEISPLGKLLLGCKLRDTVKVNTPSGIIEYKVISIKT